MLRLGFKIKNENRLKVRVRGKLRLGFKIKNENRLNIIERVK
jgi:hypothetical protein